MFANKPEMAKEWAAETDFSKLPEKAKKKSKEVAVGLNDQEKLAVEVVPGGLPSRLTSLTLGRLYPRNLLNLILTGRAYHNASAKDRPEKHQAIAKAMEAAAPDQLNDTVVRLEGTDLIDDMLWKKRHGDQDPGRWYNRIGGRIMQNPRTSLLGKGFGMVGAIPSSLLTNLTRSSHYNPAADAASIYGDEPAVTTHELGHAIDFNDQSGKNPGLVGKLTRDGYDALYTFVPPLRLFHEGQANLKSRSALDQGLKDKPDDLHNILVRRDRVLPAGYGSYVGGLVPPLLGANPMALTGLVAGKAMGIARAGVREREYAAQKANEKSTPSTGNNDYKKDKKDKKETDKEAAVIDLVKIATERPLGYDPGAAMAGKIRAIAPARAGSLVPILTLGGAALGAARSPSVYGTQGAGRGALYGGGLGLGAGVGGLIGNEVGGGKGALLGAVLGGGLGLGGARLIMGTHPRQKDREATEIRQRMKAEEKARSKMASVNKLARLLSS
jgi:hypothetical protein